jgi:hypothetical protein
MARQVACNRPHPVYKIALWYLNGVDQTLVAWRQVISTNESGHNLTARLSKKQLNCVSDCLVTVEI